MARMTKEQKAAAEALAIQEAAEQEAARKVQIKAARAQAKQLKAEREARERSAKKAATTPLGLKVGQMQEAMHANIEDLMAGFEMPSPTRVIVGCLLGLAAAGVVGYGIGTLMVYALAGVATLTAGTFVTFALSVIVWILGIYAAWKIGGWVAGKVFSSVVLPEGLASRSYESIANAASGAKDTAAGWFSGAKERVEQFSGAHVVRAA